MIEAIKPVLRFWRLLKLYRKEIYQIYLYAVLNGLVNLSLPLGIQAIINFIQGAEITSSWMVLVGFVLVGIAVTGILQILQLRIVENIQQNIFARSSFEFASRIPRIKLSELDNIHAPELVNRFFDTLTIQKGLPKILIDFSLAAFQVIFGLLLLAFYSPYFIILGLFLCFLLWLIFKFTGPAGLETSLKESKYKYQLAHWLEEVARTNKTFKVSANSNLPLQKTDAIAANYLQAREKHFRILLRQFQYFIGFKVFIAAGLLILGSILVFQQQMNIGQFVASEIIIILIINSIEKLIRIIDTIYDVLTALEKIGYVTDLTMDERKESMQPLSEKGIAIEAIDLEFGYPDQKVKLLNNLSFKIPPSAKVLISGGAGAGKSTLLHLISGLYDFDDGEILLDDIPVYNYNKEKLYETIGFYFPSNQLFEGTIVENITLGRPIPEKDVLDTINFLGLKQYIALQHKGIHSLIDPEGKRLPRSIIQKLLIARAIVNKPRLLIMEDPLQSVNQTEKKKIIDHIMDPKNEWTVIVVSDDPYWKAKSTQTIQLKSN
ncbi:MAG: ABC transporter ATP-binding protein [Lewinellaceae bacterium]|nr:ABC transporter ATP-binding protein [Saprospiraceae bacterium]MCB9314730.1 ABC transporter ATP-binding protein [Lewinellaceae bacterium]MCB9331445.1 ABC transporter ATP-binding protein [Lewinellaceae bacterium]